MEKYIHKHKELLILSVLGIAFFFIYSFLPLTAPAKFISPDENANYFFVNNLTENTRIYYEEELNAISEGVIHPRQSILINDKIVPRTFPGFAILYGIIGKINNKIILYITPLLSVIGVIFFYLLVKLFFNKNIALFSAVILFIFPPFWYWSSRTMMSNIAATVFLIAGIYYFFKMIKSESDRVYFESIMSPILLGVSLTIRQTYLLFIIPLAIILFIKRKKINWKPVVILLTICLLFVILNLTLNDYLYGSAFKTGYSLKQSGENIEAVASETKISNKSNSSIYLNILKNFNIFSSSKWWNIFNNFYNVYFKIANGILVISLIGLFVFYFKNKKRNEYVVYVVIMLAITTIYYLNNRIILPGLDISYVRYLLPILILIIPFSIYLIFCLKDKRIKIGIVIFIVFTSSLSILNVKDGLGYLKDKKQQYYEEMQRVVSLTEPNAVLLTQYSDKIIFPERKVGYIRGVDDDKMSEIVSNLKKKNIPLYFVDDLKSSGLDHEKLNIILRDNGYVLENVYHPDLIYNIHRIQ